MNLPNQILLDSIDYLSNLELQELDKAIYSLQRARNSRAEYLACIVFKPGKFVKFTHPTTSGEVLLSGKCIGPDQTSGKIRVEVPNSSASCVGTIIVDVGRVTESHY